MEHYSAQQEMHLKYKKQILNAFPSALHSDLNIVLNILPFEPYQIELPSGQYFELQRLIYPESLHVQWNNQELIIPHRIYLHEPDENRENQLSIRQKSILNSLYLRHHNGYIRQRRLEKLLDQNDAWIVPFTLQLLGEYVFELLPLLDQHINNYTIKYYQHFINENPIYWQRTQNRMISYWNEYYRLQYPKLNEYLGKRIIKRLNTF